MTEENSKLSDIEYLQSHKLDIILQDALKTLIKEMPHDPKSFLINYFEENRKMNEKRANFIHSFLQACRN